MPKAKAAVLAGTMLLLLVLVVPPGHSKASSQYVPSGPIWISGDDDWLTESAVSGGSGTSSDPFIIEGLAITPSTNIIGISIQHTRAHFVIRGSYFSNCSNGVALYNVSNGRIENNIFVDSGMGVTVSYSSDCAVVGNSISDCIVGVGIYYSDDISVKSNIFSNNEKNIDTRKAFAPWETTWLGTAVCIGLAIPLTLVIVVLVRFRMLKKKSEKPPTGPDGSA